MYLFLESAAGTTAAGSSASMILMFVVLIAASLWTFFDENDESGLAKEFVTGSSTAWERNSPSLRTPARAAMSC